MTILQLTIDSRTLTYQVVPSALSRVWLEFMRGFGQLSWRKFEQASLIAQGTELVAQQALDHLCARMAIHYQDLNDLHLQFQQQMEQTQYTPEWARINDLVHQLEKPTNSDQATLRFYLDYGDRNLPDIIPELRESWGHRAQSGDLCLGYHTIGKTLWHACRDQDLAVVRTGQLRPQTTISTEMLFFWGRTDPKNNADRTFLIGQWLAQHQLTDCVDLDNPLHQYHGEPLLARLIDPSPESVLTWITAHSQVEQFQILPLSRG